MLAERQHGVVSIAQLRWAGLGDGAIKRRVAAGRLHPVHRRVYAVGHRRITPTGDLWAAVLAYGGPGRAIVSHLTAAALYDLVQWPARLELTTATQRRSTATIRVHHSRTLTLDAIRRDPEIGVRMTTFARTAIDLTPRLDDHRLKRLVHRAAHLQILDVPDPCPRRLRTAIDTLTLAPPQITRSELEERFLALAAQAGLPPPLVNHREGRYTADFIWPELRLIVETDGARTHNTDLAFVDDRRRDVTQKLAGWETLRFTWHDVVDDPDWVVDALRHVAAISRSGTSASG